VQRRHRLTGNKEYRDVRIDGRSCSHPLMVLRARANGLAYSRFGFVAGKRIGKAVVRNRVKRRLREATRARLTDIEAGWDVVLIARPAIVHARYVDVIKAMDELLGRARLRGAASAAGDVAE